MKYPGMAARLRAARTAKKITQKAIAKHVGISSCMIVAMERDDHTGIFPKHAVLIAEALGISPDWLMYGVDPGFHVPEPDRVIWGRLASTAAHGNNGAFQLKFGEQTLDVICSDGEGWEHVSVSTPTRCPTWEEMAYVASQFWSPDAVLLQYRPAAKDYVNHHPYCLHWWRPIGVLLPVPPTFMIGPKG